MFFEFCKLISKAIQYFRYRKKRNNGDKWIDKWRSNVIEIQHERATGKGAGKIEDIEDTRGRKNKISAMKLDYYLKRIEN